MRGPGTYRNVQVVFVAVAAWLLFGERRPMHPLIAGTAGVALTSGLARDAFGSRPGRAVIGVSPAPTRRSRWYREANRTPGPRRPRWMTLGMVVGAVACAVFDRHFTFTPGRAAHFWLVLLAVGSQVIGWLLIGRALPELPAIETSILLLGQPIFAVMWGLLFFDERLSALQWAGSAIVLAGVAMLSVQAMPARN